jgi:glutamate dehydrogenase/leucine dehydrogenase
MKHLHFFLTLPLFILLAACYATDRKTGTSDAGHTVDELTKDSSAKITHEDGWTIVSRMENTGRVYWFLAPEVDNVSPAMFQKIIYTGDKRELESKIVSECEAPKQTCDDLMKQFKVMSEKYK